MVELPRPVAWMATRFGGQPAQATTDEPTAIRWRKAGGDVRDLISVEDARQAVAHMHSAYCHSQQQFVDAQAELAALRAERDAARADAERLKIRGDAYETAYGIAYKATYQSHNGHWDATMQGGLGCRECIKAREARESCDAALRDGLQGLIDRAAITATKETTK